MFNKRIWFIQSELFLQCESISHKYKLSWSFTNKATHTQSKRSFCPSVSLVRRLVNLHNLDMFFFFLCTYILAVWHDPRGRRGCFVSGWPWEKEAHSFHSCTAAMEAPGSPRPPAHSDPPPFINTAHYSTLVCIEMLKRAAFLDPRL